MRCWSRIIFRPACVLAFCNFYALSEAPCLLLLGDWTIFCVRSQSTLGVLCAWPLHVYSYVSQLTVFSCGTELTCPKSPSSGHASFLSVCQATVCVISCFLAKNLPLWHWTDSRRISVLRSFFQSICVLGYCIFPLTLAALLCLFVGWSKCAATGCLLMRLGFVGAGLLWSTKGQSSHLLNHCKCSNGGTLMRLAFVAEGASKTVKGTFLFPTQNTLLLDVCNMLFHWSLLDCDVVVYWHLSHTS